MPIPFDDQLRVGVISDASWGNARQADWPEGTTEIPGRRLSMAGPGDTREQRALDQIFTH